LVFTAKNFAPASTLATSPTKPTLGFGFGLAVSPVLQPFPEQPVFRVLRRQVSQERRRQVSQEFCLLLGISGGHKRNGD